MDNNLQLFSWVARGKQKRAVIKAMDKIKTPSQIYKKAKELNNKLSLNNTSDILREFRKKGIAVCLNEDKRMRRLYELTEIGKEIRELIFKSNIK